MTALRQDREDFSAEDWARFLSGQLGRSVRVRYGRARRQVIVAYPERAGLRVRMNHAFGRAPEPVRIAVADWLRVGRHGRAACRALDDWIASIVGTLGPPRLPRILTRGAHHDLGAMLLDLLAHEFRALPDERRPSAVTWGRRGPRGALRSLQLGSFDPETALIRIHPVLDQPAVPSWFVRYVLFHELLHSELNQPCRSAKRSQHHGREFRRREAAYFDTAGALAWQDRNLSALLRSARTGSPIRVARTKHALCFVQQMLFE